MYFLDFIMKKFLLFIVLSFVYVGADPSFSIDGTNTYYVYEGEDFRGDDLSVLPGDLNLENDYSIYHIYNDIDVNNSNTTTFNDAIIDNSGSGGVHIGATNTYTDVRNYAGEGSGSGLGGSFGSGSYGSSWFSTL